jgi:hypothetical protein
MGTSAVCAAPVPFDPGLVTFAEPEDPFSDVPMDARTRVTSVVGFALALCSAQQRPQRHSARQAPFASCARIKRHPIELTSVWSVLVSGERAPQSTHVSRFCMGCRWGALARTPFPMEIERRNCAAL